MYSPALRPSGMRAAPAKNRRLSTIGGISSDIVTVGGLAGVLGLDACTNSSALSSIASASLSSASWRSFGVVSNQVSSKAFLAAATALFDVLGRALLHAWPITAPVCGLMMSRVAAVGRVDPLAADEHLMTVRHGSPPRREPHAVSNGIRSDRQYRAFAVARTDHPPEGAGRGPAIVRAGQTPASALRAGPPAGRARAAPARTPCDRSSSTGPAR